MKTYYAYVRVSTARQGHTGTSLAEQREAIQRYAARNNLRIVQEFEEQETAAKQGRAVFDRMLKDLKARKASGVIIHKIDRSARNLRDWASLGELNDAGCEVHFANESIDLQSRGGRLSADIQAVVAADFIRNLREETKKGFYGRIKQGLYPMPARIGYLDQGKGLPKLPDPTHAPLVRHAFELYGSGNWSLPRLVDHMYELGLRNTRGNKVSLNGLSTVLHNPFYMGVIRMYTNGQMYPGKHEPIISPTLFKRVQAVFSGKRIDRSNCHSFLFRRHLRCGFCEHTLIGELQKHRVYYRCHARDCEQKTIREDAVEDSFTDALQRLRFDRDENEFMRAEIKRMYRDNTDLREAQVKSLQLQQEQLSTRQQRLTDAYLDGVFDEDTYHEKKNSLIMDEAVLRERANAIGDVEGVVQRTERFLELSNNAYLSYKRANFENKREMVKTVTSNFIVEQKSAVPKLYLPFQMVVERHQVPSGSPHRAEGRTVPLLLSQLRDYFLENEVVKGSSYTQILTE